MAVILFYDTETTGLNPEKCGIHQISGAFVVNGKIEESFNYYIKPKEGCECSKEAMDLAGCTYEEMMASDKYIPMHEAFLKIYERMVYYCGGVTEKGNIEWGKKIYTAGYNIHKFDGPFMRQWFKDNGAGEGKEFLDWGWITSGELDVMLIAEPVLMKVRNRMKNFKQYSVAAALGIPVEESRLHEAGYDIELCFKIYKTLVERGYVKVMAFDDFEKTTAQILEERKEKETCDMKIPVNS